ncbi:MAG: hypothetical protein MI862_17790 [Desulfobacterales bacterium]|nr:hypothetical protein [Desulfobacterales bacterium]
MKQKIVITSLDTARFTCPECKKQKVMQLSPYHIKKQETEVRCKCICGHVSGVILERSDESIQQTQLLGTFMSKDRIQCSGKMVIKKLNSRGIMFKTNIEQNIIPGLQLFLEFVLDDAKQSIVQKDVRVKAKKGKYLSAEFVSNEHDDNLGPYLSFNKLFV